MTLAIDLSSFRVTERGIAIATGLQQMLVRTEWSHWCTLSFNCARTTESMQKSLRFWTLDVVSRIFRRHLFQRYAIDNLLYFVALREHTKAGHPHFHLLVRVHPHRHDWFERSGAKLWRHIVPSGTADIQRIGNSAEDQVRVIEYGTKMSNRPFSYNTFIASTMLHLPQTRRGTSPEQIHVTDDHYDEYDERVDSDLEKDPKRVAPVAGVTPEPDKIALYVNYVKEARLEARLETLARRRAPAPAGHPI